MPSPLRRAVLSLASALATPALAEEPDRVERVEIAGTHQMPSGSYLFYVSTKPGDRYDEVRLRGDFRRLWETGFLEDLRLEVEPGAAGRVVRFRVAERPRLRVVDFQGSQELSPAEIAERLEKEDATLALDHFFDPGRARRAEGVVRRMLGEKGYLFASVKHEARPLGGSGVQVSFVIADGLRARLRQVDFEGNEAFSDGRLKRRMKTKERGFWNLSWLKGSDVYNTEKWEEDQRRLTDFYLDQGHVQASVGQPTPSFADGRIGWLRKKPVKWVDLKVPVEEGAAFHVGSLDFRGLTVFDEALVRPLFALKPGDLYRESRVRKGYERLRDAYGARGYPLMTGRTERTPDPARGVVDLVVAVDEDKRYHVGRIAFTGNASTRDAVLRREVFLNEGDVLNTEALRQSVRRLNQLGYFKTVESPRIEPGPGGSDRLDVTFPLEERNGSVFTLAAATGPLGPTLSGSYATSNLFGRGQTFEVELERGEHYRKEEVSILEPYFRGRPVSLGARLHRQRSEYDGSEAQGAPAYSIDSKGFGGTLGAPLRRFTRFDIGYSLAFIDPHAGEGVDTELVGVRRTESRLSPVFSYNTVDSPLAPRRGLQVRAGLNLIGGPLGGSVDYVEPHLKVVGWVPHTGRTALGLRVEGGWLRPFGATAAPGTRLPNGLPYDRRYRLGGDTSLRGFGRDDVGPRDADGTLIGGNKYVLGSAEYAFDIAGPLRAVAFVDAGQSFAEGQTIDLGRLKTSTGVELRFLVPVLNVPVRLIQSWNLNRGGEPHQAREFRLTFGTSF
jgi:outer membrane protein insertion porin family